MSDLAFPTGVTPGFNQMHLLTDGNRCILSAVASGANMLDLTTGQPGVVVGTISRGIKKTGPFASFAASATSNFTRTATTWSNLSGVNACGIIRANGAGNANFFATDSSGTPTNTSLQIGQSFNGGGGLLLLQTSGSNSNLAGAGGAQFTNSTDYFFFAASSTTAGNMVVKNLATGVIGTNTFASGLGSWLIGSAGTGNTIYVGAGYNGAGNWTGDVAALQVSTCSRLLSLKELVKIADNPWEPWYPTTNA